MVGEILGSELNHGVWDADSFMVPPSCMALGTLRNLSVTELRVL